MLGQLFLVSLASPGYHKPEEGEGAYPTQHQGIETALHGVPFLVSINKSGASVRQTNFHHSEIAQLENVKY